jgi:MFS transporter, DHA2 family, methylenomycin A resistance protein
MSVTEQIGQTVNRSAAVKLSVLAVGFATGMLDTTVMNVSGLTVMNSLGMSLTGLTWAVEAYVLSFAALLLLGGALATRFGARSVYLTGLAVFVVFSLIAGLAPNGAVLVGARLLQGAGTALAMPSSLTLLSSSFPDRAQRARMVGLWTAIVASAAAIGPMVGGLLTDTVGWRSIFLINVPIGIAGWLGARLVIAPVPGRPGKPSLTGHGLGIAALALLAFTLIEGPRQGWDSAWILVFATAVAATAFVLRERRSQRPVLPPGLFADRRFSAAVVAGFFLNCAVFGRFFVVGVYLQDGAGLTALWTGVLLFPVSLAYMVGNLLFAHVSRQFGASRPMILGFSAAAGASLPLVAVSAGMPYWLLALLLAISNVAAGIAVPGITATMLDTAGLEHANIASSTLQAVREVGSLVGVALAGAVLVAVPGIHAAAAVFFLIAAVCLFVTAALTARYNRSPSRPPSPR